MFQKGSYDFECQLASYTESLAEGEHSAMPKLDAQKEAAAVRKEQQRFNILRYLRSH